MISDIELKNKINELLSCYNGKMITPLVIHEIGNKVVEFANNYLYNLDGLAITIEGSKNYLTFTCEGFNNNYHIIDSEVYFEY